VVLLATFLQIARKPTVRLHMKHTGTVLVDNRQGAEITGGAEIKSSINASTDGNVGLAGAAAIAGAMFEMTYSDVAAVSGSFYKSLAMSNIVSGRQIRAGLPGSRKPILPAQLDVTLGRFDIGRARAATRRPMSPLRSTASNRRLIDMA